MTRDNATSRPTANAGCIGPVSQTTSEESTALLGTQDGDGARWLQHVTDEQYKAAATAVETD